MGESGGLKRIGQRISNEYFALNLLKMHPACVR